MGSFYKLLSSSLQVCLRRTKCYKARMENRCMLGAFIFIAFSLFIFPRSSSSSEMHATYNSRSNTESVPLGTHDCFSYHKQFECKVCTWLYICNRTSELPNLLISGEHHPLHTHAYGYAYDLRKRTRIKRHTYVYL